MTESERIFQNINGELPKGEKTIIRVSNIQNPQKVLEECKQIVLDWLLIQSSSNDSAEWQKALPKQMVQLIHGLTHQDCRNDELLFGFDLLIDDWKRLKKWGWYSSKLTERGFEIVTTGSFSPRFIWLIHYQGIPYSKIWIMDDRRGHYAIDVLVDVTTYK